MNNGLQKLKKKLDNNELAIGTVVTLNDPEISDMLCSCGFDFIWIDAEHGPLDKNMINMHIMAIRGAGVAPFVRIPWNDPVLIKPILDMGPAGIIFPFIKTAEEAKLAVSSCKYPPRGIRGFGPRRSINFFNMDIDEYLKISESEPWVLLQIEHIEGVNNLEEIVKVNGVDMIIIGPCDLSGSIGLLGQTNHPEVVKLYNRISDICKRAGINFFPAIGYENIENLVQWIERGASMLALDTDLDHIVGGGRRAISAAREASEKIKK